MVAAGIVAGALAYTGGRTEQDVAVIVQFQPWEWLSLSAAPGAARTRVAGRVASGLRDVPVSATVSYSLTSVPIAPTIAAGLTESVATADSASGLGYGRGLTSAAAAVSVWPTEWLALALSVARPLRTNSHSGWLGLESSLSLGRLTASAGMSSELGPPDTGVPVARSATAGVAWSLAGPVALTVDATQGLTSTAPSWSFALGFGTAFSGLSPLDPSSGLQRVKKAFTKLSSAGIAKPGKTDGSCKKPRIC